MWIGYLRFLICTTYFEWQEINANICHKNIHYQNQYCDILFQQVLMPCLLNRENNVQFV